MLKKLIAYQRLLLNSTPPIDIRFQSPFKQIPYIFAILVMTFMNMFIFMGNTLSTNDIIPIVLPIISIWVINRILYGDQRLFETVPVNRKYTALNIFLLSVVIIIILYVVVSLVGLSLAGILFSVLYLVSPNGFSKSPPESAVHQIINTTKGNMLMLCILVIIIFVGTTITFIKNKKLRYSSFALFATIGYGLLFFLKSFMPISPSSDKVEFLESFSVMPQANTILICIAVATVILATSSVFIGGNLYIGKLNSPQQ
ncbi:hypothetical protein K9O30_11885 [Clostridium bowmanii]|uniref:hypothetical protein n=1 Tax=Clostridium bowmanii TaxID=132925 RepID=UPI001C0CC74A|nr:hypothetical protein [Clostridium bowmanii]MBU3189924.1 hypothetical protein [Clostridium bowmanii]MCA1074408.1 hypothetical protein [Clostridium bowmanii]